MNVIPKCLDSSSKYPVFENLPETYAAINTYLVNSPLEGKLQFLYISLMSYFNVTHLPKKPKYFLQPTPESGSLHCLQKLDLSYDCWKTRLVLDIFLLVSKDWNTCKNLLLRLRDERIITTLYHTLTERLQCIIKTKKVKATSIAI